MQQISQGKGLELKYHEANGAELVSILMLLPREYLMLP